MELSPGTKVGPYEILSLIGAGGMGQVYKGRDTRLDRIVAIKLLPSELAGRTNRRRRFDVEARAISSLNHPHICALFDIGEDDGRAFLVMEYLEGETLDDRLTRGALPAAEVVRHAAAIADALDHAHRQQIVHRDLKPSNVMLTATGAKLLDFGLAKRADRDPPALVSTASFDHKNLTADGIVLGTVQYMAPEQLEGRPTDARTDIFAFGVLLYEMATGRKAFQGDSQASLIASILTAHPPAISATRSATSGDSLPTALDHIVERSLAKNPADRWQTARDIKLELDWSSKGGASSRAGQTTAVQMPRRWREMLAWTLAAMAIAAAAGIALLYHPSSPARMTVFTIPPPPGTVLGLAQNRTRIAISPDGRHLAFHARTEGRLLIWVRPLGSVEGRPLPGTEGGMSPVWSPDSRFIAFFVPTVGEIRRIDAAGGPARTICQARTDGSLTWGRDGTILYTQFRDGLFRVSAEGGTPVRVTQVDKTKGEMNHYWPAFLPDGRTFLYMATAVDASNLRVSPTVYAASLDDPGHPTRVARMHSGMVYAPTGHVLFVEDGALMAQNFDVANRTLVGNPVKIAGGVGHYKTLGNGAFTISATGVLAYQGGEQTSHVSWYDRRGAVTDTEWGKENFGQIRLSPDGERMAVDVTDSATGLSNIWLYDVSRGAPIRLTTHGFATAPVWSPDSRRIAFSTGRSQAPALAAMTLDGREDKLADVNSPMFPEDWSPDGKWIIYTDNTSTSGADLWLLALTESKMRPFVNTQAEEFDARFAPDSRWVAFVSSEAGPPEVYVRAIDGGEKTRISVGGGTSPRWRADGKELFYIAADNRSVMAVSVAPGDTFKAGVPARLFSLRLETVAKVSFRYGGFDVHPGGQRFLISSPLEDTTSRITVVLNWTEALKQQGQ